MDPRAWARHAGERRFAVAPRELVSQLCYLILQLANPFALGDEFTLELPDYIVSRAQR